MKYLDFYIRVLGRYKIILYCAIATLVLLEHKLIAYTLYALAFYEFSILCIEFYKENKNRKYDNKENDIMIMKLKLEEKKEETKKQNAQNKFYKGK